MGEGVTARFWGDMEASEVRPGVEGGSASSGNEEDEGRARLGARMGDEQGGDSLVGG